MKKKKRSSRGPKAAAKAVSGAVLTTAKAVSEAVSATVSTTTVARHWHDTVTTVSRLTTKPLFLLLFLLLLPLPRTNHKLLPYSLLLCVLQQNRLNFLPWGNKSFNIRQEIIKFPFLSQFEQFFDSGMNITIG